MSTAAAMARAAPSVTVVWRDSVVTSMGCRGSSWRLDAGRWAGARGLLEGKDTGPRPAVRGGGGRGSIGRALDARVGRPGFGGAQGPARSVAFEQPPAAGGGARGTRRVGG